MYEIPMTYVYFWLIIVSLIGVGVTIVDKQRAMTNHRRIREKTLMMWGALGGAAAMLLTMITIRHKTRHPKFMVGFPLIVLAQVAIFLWLWNGTLVNFLW